MLLFDILYQGDNMYNLFIYPVYDITREDYHSDEYPLIHLLLQSNVILKVMISQEEH